MDIVATQATLEAILNHTAKDMIVRIKKANLAIPGIVLQRLTLAAEQEATAPQAGAADAAEAADAAAYAAPAPDDASGVS